MNGSENSNSFTRKYVGLRYRGAAGAGPRAEETPGLSRPQPLVRPVPFNGLLTNRLLASLPGADFARLLPHLEPVALSHGEDLYRFGAPVAEVYFPENAVLSQLLILEDGSTTESALVGWEGMVGLSAVFAAPPPQYLTKVTVAGTALRMCAATLRQEFERGGAVQSTLLAYAGARIAQLSQKAVCNGRHTVGERLCCWLLMIHDRACDDQLPLTHEQIAHHLGARRAGISEAASSLRDKQIISYVRGRIHILDRQALEAAACECYRTLNRQTPLAAQPSTT